MSCLKWMVVVLAGMSVIIVSPSEGLLRMKRTNTEARIINKLYSRDSLSDFPSNDLQRLIKASSSSSPNHQEMFQRHKRSEESCGMSQELTHEPQDLDEKAETIQAIWVGKDEILIIACDKSETGTTTVWRGKIKDSIQMFHFTSDSSLINRPVYPNSLQTSSADNRQTVIVVSLNRKFIYVSRTAGNTWSMYHTPTPEFNPEEELYLSGRDPRHMIIRDNTGTLYVSENAGQNWNNVARGVQLVEMVTINPRVEYIYYSTQSQVSDHAPLYRMNIADRHTKVIDHSAYRFRVDNRFLFVSRKNITGHKEADDKSRRLYVATNYDQAKVTFSEVQLPSLQDQQFYVVMGTHETGAFIHVYDGSAQEYGDLYVSDSSGVTFSLSLKNHLFQVHYSLFSGHFTLHDFYEVTSTRGVYITTAYDGSDESHLVTMITYDNGGVWQRIPAPANSHCDDGVVCSLHLYLKSSQHVSHQFNLSTASGPLSIKSAPDIIIAHGNVGTYSQVNKLQNIYISSDGGHSWKETAIPVGTYVYGIADYGNIIAVAPDTTKVEYIWVSHDRGDCFVRKTLDTAKVFELSRGLLIDPSAASLYGFVMGVEGTAEDDEWRVITIYFKTLLNRQCDVDDYTSVKAQSCVMGYKPVYNLTKPSAVCYNDASYKYQPIQNISCQCSYLDYECDYGYQRSDRNTCSKMTKVPDLSVVCPPGQDTYTQSDSGFRLIPGDVCSQTNQSKQLLTKKTHKCSGHEEMSGFDVNGSHNKGVKVFGGIVILVAILIAAGLFTYCVLKCKKNSKTSRERVYYQRLPLHETGSKFSANDESSDEDLITPT